MKVRQKSVPAFIVGLISAILGLVGSLLSGFSGLGLGFIIAIPLLLLPSILILIGSIICMFKAKAGGIIMTIALVLYFIGIIILNIGLGIVSVIAFPLILSALVLAFLYPKVPKNQTNAAVGELPETIDKKKRQKAVPAFIVGLIGAILGFVGAILSIFSGLGLGLFISVPLLLLPSILILIGSIVCMFKAKAGGITITVAFVLYTIGILIMNIGSGVVSIIALPLIVAALILAFLYPKVQKDQPAVSANTVPVASYQQTANSAITPTVSYSSPANSATEPAEGSKVTYAPLFSAGVNSLSVLGLIFAFFMPILGLLFGLTGMHDAKYHAGRGRGMGLTAALLSILMTLILVPILMFCLILR